MKRRDFLQTPLALSAALVTQQSQATVQFSSGALILDALGQVVSRTTQKDRKEKMIIATLQKPKAIIPAGELQHLQADPIFKARFQTKP
ncbi:MAG: hypothetical protein ACREEM_55525 [Blastocatellia bacterium]